MLDNSNAISNGYAIFDAFTEDVGSIDDTGAAHTYERASDETCNLTKRLPGTSI